MTTEATNEAGAAPAAETSTAETIRRLHTENPDMPLSEVAKKVGKPLRYVYTTLYAMRKKQREEKAARAAARAAKKAAKAGATLPTTTPAAAEAAPAKRKRGRPSKAEIAARAVKQPSIPATPMPSDPVNRPAHYTDGGMEVIDVLKAKLSPEEFRGYLRGNVIKYAARMGKKDGAAVSIDAGKMAWYAARLASEAAAAR